MFLWGGEGVFLWRGEGFFLWGGEGVFKDFQEPAFFVVDFVLFQISFKTAYFYKNKSLSLLITGLR